MTTPAPSREVVSFPRRFNGPPRSGNGGYVCGRMACYVTGAASVRLRVPPPLDRDMDVETAGDEARLFDGDTLVAQARCATLDLAAPAAPSFAAAETAAKTYAAFARHPLPHCFVCGLARADGDGLRIFPGPIGDAGMLAAAWVPDPSLDDGAGRVATEFLWAALDCPGAFAVMRDPEQPLLLGEMTARIDGALAIGEPCVVTAWPLGIDGRKLYAGTALHTSAGAPIAIARATWIEIAAMPAGPS